MTILLDDNEQEERRESSVSPKFIFGLILILVIIPFLPGLILSFLYYYIFLRKLHFKKSMDFFVSALIILPSLIFIVTTDAIEKFKYVLLHLSEFSSLWTDALYLVIPVNLIVAALVGFFIVLSEIRKMKITPHLTQLEGMWQYGFKFRPTPFEKLKKKKAIDDLKHGKLRTVEKAPLGFDEDNDLVTYRYIEEAVKMSLVLGAAGSGKTVSLLSLMKADIEAGRSVLAVDFKRSPEFAAKLAKWSAERNIEFYHFESGSPKGYLIEDSLGQCSYDPFASGAGAEMILGMREYDTASAVYKTNMQQVLQIIFAMMKQADKSKAPHVDWTHGGIIQLASVLTPNNLKEVLIACEGRPIYKDAEALVLAATATSKNNISHSVEELRGQMRTLIASQYGGWLKIEDRNADRHINLKEMLTGEKQVVILFSFNAESEPDLSKYMGSIIFSDLSAVSGHIRNMKASKITNVYVDEFQAVPPTAVTGLLEKARASKIAMTLAQQALEQVITSAQSNGEAYLDSILVTCSNFYIHAGMTQKSAERISNIVGKEWVTVYSKTQKNSALFLSINFWNRREQIVNDHKEERWRRDPGDFMALSAPSEMNGYKSEAIIINKSPSDPNIKTSGAISRRVWMIPDNDVLSDYTPPQISSTFDDDLYDDEAQEIARELNTNSVEVDPHSLAHDENSPVMMSTDSDLMRNYRNRNKPMANVSKRNPVTIKSYEEDNFNLQDPFEEELSNNSEPDLSFMNIHEDDGDFGFEEIDDSSQNNQSGGTGVFDTSLDAFASDYVPKSQPRKETRTVRQNESSKKTEEPKRPRRSAPKRPTRTISSPQTSNIEEELSLEGLMDDTSIKTPKRPAPNRGAGSSSSKRSGGLPMI